MALGIKYQVVAFFIGLLSFFLAVWLMPYTLPYVQKLVGGFITSELLHTFINWAVAYALAVYAFPNLLFRLYVGVAEQ